MSTPPWLARATQTSGLRPLWTDGTRLLAARGYRLVERRGMGCVRCVADVPAPSAWCLLAAHVRVLRQGLRLGIHNAWPLADGCILVVTSRRLHKVDPSRGASREVARIRHGNKPGFNGVLVCPDGTTFYAEYSLNPDRRLPSGVYRSGDHGETFSAVHEFHPGDVRHIHFIQWDPYGACLWLGTGDRDDESHILTSHDNGATWNVVGGGSQQWRAIGVAFTPTAVFWGTDAGLDAGRTPNSIVRWDRQTRAATPVQSLQGPCHGIGCLADGTLWIATGVEGGCNEKDRQCHLWMSGGNGFHEIASWTKDPWPAVVQIGCVHFPHGMENSRRLEMALLGIRGCGETLWETRDAAHLEGNP